MTRGEAIFLRAAHAAAALSGVAWFWMATFAESDDPYAVVQHPWQPGMQAAHLLAAPALILAVGLIWKTHTWSRIRSGFTARRRSGLALSLLFLPMALSGYLLQVAVDESARRAWQWSHVAASLVWLGAWIVHRWPRPRARVKAE